MEYTEHELFHILDKYGTVEEYERLMSGPIADYQVWEIEEPTPPTRWEQFKSIFST